MSIGYGCPNGIDTDFVDSSTLKTLLEWDQMYIAMLDEEYYPTGYGSVSNISILSGDFGDEGILRHRIPVEADDPHTYQMVTRAAQARAILVLILKLLLTLIVRKRRINTCSHCNRIPN